MITRQLSGGSLFSFLGLNTQQGSAKPPVKCSINYVEITLNRTLTSLQYQWSFCLIKLLLFGPLVILEAHMVLLGAPAVILQFNLHLEWSETKLYTSSE